MRLPVCCCLLLLFVAGSRGQEHDDFSLEDAFGPEEAKPTIKPQPGQPGGGAVDPLDGLGFGIPTVPPKKTTIKPKSGGDGGFDLGDAVGGEDPYKKPTLKPQPGLGGGGGGGGGFGDSDLSDGHHHGDPSDHDDKPSGRELQPSAGGEQGQEGEKQSVVAGIVSAVAVAAVGAVSSFIAYQKKKLCFKGATEDPENVNMDSHKGDRAEPQAQSTLLAK